MPSGKIVIGIVGPSKSGKSTLKQGLEELGYSVKHIAQEHSFAPAMWEKIAKPDVLIYLDVSYEETLKRGQPNWEEADFEEERRRLEHARQHADCYIDTGELSSEEALAQVLGFLENNGK